MFGIGDSFFLDRYEDEYSPEEVVIIGGVVYKGKKYLVAILEEETVC